MDKPLTILNERVDDIPLVLAQLERMGLPDLLDTHFPTHGNWKGLSLGWVTCVWIAHILSQADHRLNHVQPWAQQLLQTLCRCTGQTVRDLDFSDDRLGDILRALSDEQRWHAFETALTGKLIRVYDLSCDCVRLDATTASSYREVIEAGLFQLGHSKDHRPDLPQIKTMLSTLDPLGMPLACDVASGEKADDPLYVPNLKRVREGLGRKGVLYVGDCKFAALSTRAVVACGGDFYLCPLSGVQVSAEVLAQLLRPVLVGIQPLTPVYRIRDDTPEVIACGYEVSRTQTALVEGQETLWTERWLVVRSAAHAQAAERGLRERLDKAKQALSALNGRGRGKPHFTQVAPLQQASEAILKRYGVADLLVLEYPVTVCSRPVRRYKDRPAIVVEERDVQVRFTLNGPALLWQLEALGWRVFVTNQSADRLCLEAAVLLYRGEYVIERGMSRLKGQPLSLTPIYLQNEAAIIGLVRLLSVCLRVLTLCEFVVGRGLHQEGTKLAGLYAGAPKRSTATPTTELLLKAFEGITLTLIVQPEQTWYHVSALSPLQQTILRLLDLPTDTYEKVCGHSTKPP